MGLLANKMNITMGTFKYQHVCGNKSKVWEFQPEKNTSFNQVIFMS